MDKDKKYKIEIGKKNGLWTADLLLGINYVDNVEADSYMELNVEMADAGFVDKLNKQ